ncbi:unnamed protein product [Cyprideis torosa]|uniref:Uncharacterized protein n=1 Tax=Cyprideis torosa TaxID=163714 RepID=A0A7R8ZUS7_9CRUS|nr:unnamed protein product [Cyprideis torosa]CAG0909378.1 unnamed protein product [Cyprideis torosa]
MKSHVSKRNLEQTMQFVTAELRPKATHERLNNQREVDSVKTESEKMITLSLENYINALMVSKDDVDLNIFRFVYLWMQWLRDAGWRQRELSNLDKIPFHKFLPVLRQMMENMAGGDATSTQIRQVIGALLIDFEARCSSMAPANARLTECVPPAENVAKQHPHHAVPLLLAHANTDRDCSSPTPGPEANASQRTGSPTTAVAMDILNKLKEVPELKELVRQWETMVSAMINAVDPSDSPLSMDGEEQDE